MSAEMPSSPYRLDFKAFHDWNGDRPSQTLIFHNNGSSWWIKVEVDWPLPESILKLGHFQHRATFREFIEAIDFTQLPLLDNTVTSIVLSLAEQRHNPIMIRDGFQTHTNFYIDMAHQLCYTIAEDPKKVIYPTLDRDVNVPTIEATCLQNIELVAPAVSTVTFRQQKLAYKTIDRPIYIPEDTKSIMDEVEALALFSGHPNIAQLVGLVVSENPYKTCPSNDMPTVVTGFLLEYYSGGSLDKFIEESEIQKDSLPIQWATQIGSALETLHAKGRTHLDIKQSNVLLDAEQNAILIDISGTGGYTWEWLSPEIQDIVLNNVELLPWDMPFETRVAADCWAFGKLLLALAEKSGTGSVSEALRSVADGLMETAPEVRVSLGGALAQLKSRQVESAS
ncbi:hypothetical protein PENDEC_c002G01880 [Penicillium decumbens]|uniref:Protein kinase domain-containing protein n=1 Tax=Penicillium decumbens TaxID=69771 RepID=A0A1V6PKW4_PENDC|nr:hypothetical protein PENDEC_c002G01880 [Penicillium decumbens]